MPVTSDAPGPYAPGKTILDVVARHRTRGLPSPVNQDVLARSGIPESLIPRTLQALQTLDLIDDKGAPTPVLEGIRLAPEAEYQQHLVQWLNGAYADVLKFIDPATASEVAIRDAFRSYNPVGQQSRMVSLFIGLYAAAGIGSEKASQPRKPRTAGSGSLFTPSPRRAAVVKGAGHTPSPPPPPPPPPPKDSIGTFEQSLLAKFPDFDPDWDDALKAKWFDGFQRFMDMTKGKTPP